MECLTSQQIRLGIQDLPQHQAGHTPVCLFQTSRRNDTTSRGELVQSLIEIFQGQGPLILVLSPLPSKPQRSDAPLQNSWNMSSALAQEALSGPRNPEPKARPLCTHGITPSFPVPAL